MTAMLIQRIVSRRPTIPLLPLLPPAMQTICPSVRWCSTRRISTSSPVQRSLTAGHVHANVPPPILSSLQGAPISMLVPPGQCQFGPDFQFATLVDRVPVSSTSSILRFALADSSKPLQLSTCACILAKAEIPTTTTTTMDPASKTTTTSTTTIVRPYTPISTNALTGYMDLLVKNYRDKGTMSRYLHEIAIGSTDANIAFQHIPVNVKIQAADFLPAKTQKHTNIVMLAGGTGITPMIQALHAILGRNPDDSDDGGDDEMPKGPKVTLLYGSQDSQDILGKALLDQWAKDYPQQFQVVYILSDEPAISQWTDKRGRIDAELLQDHLPSLTHSVNADTTSNGNDTTLVFVCGPPPMYQALCGPREEQDTVKGILGDLGYSSRQVYKF